ncbi:hypothetical protein J4205_01700 [Candidatus Pacearchaeota archaeon]|nr:hypothetical protein [Candidatus Pacearchaeota archaeon]
MEKQKKVEWILRIAIFGTFLGHGIFAIMIKQSWIPYFTSIGFSESTAIFLLPIIGMIDVLVAISVLVKPIRAVLIYATIWAFATALIRPISGDPIWDFVERSANWGAPLALLFLKNIPKNFKEFFN